MELEASTTVPLPLYHSWISLPLSNSTPAVATSDSPLSPNGLYTVFRNEISLSTDNVCGSLSSTSQDFFSLDLEVEERLQTPPVFPTKKTIEDNNLVVDRRMESAWFRGSEKFRSPMLQLHKEIVDFAEFLSPTYEEQNSRKSAVDRVINVVKSVWPHCKVEVFGSFRTGLYLPTSDIDIVILNSGINNPQMGLRALSKVLTWKGVAKQMRVIAKARVPIIKFVEKISGIHFDLSFDLENGPVAADFIKDVVRVWPSLKPLSLVLKVFLQQRELNEVFSGGVGSYALLTMLMALLKSFPSEQNLGILLVKFFDFYGRKLNNDYVGISARDGGSFFSKRKKGFVNEKRQSLIAIEDPQDPDNDIGKNSYNYFQVRSAFIMAYSTLTNPKNILGLEPKRSILGTIIRPDGSLLRRKGGDNGEMTFKGLLPGAGEPLDGGNDPSFVGNFSFDCADEPLPRGGRDTVLHGGDFSSNKKKGYFREKHTRKRVRKSLPNSTISPL